MEEYIHNSGYYHIDYKNGNYIFMNAKIERKTKNNKIYTLYNNIK